MLRLAAILVFLAGCASNNGAPPKAPEPEPAQREEAPPPPPSDAAPAEVTPASLYAECRDRVEGPEQAGECTSDADCTTGGCGSEVCTTQAAAAELMTTCEDRLCFHVLDACGCVDGVCSWALKDEIPETPRLRPAPPTQVPDAPGPG